MPRNRFAPCRRGLSARAFRKLAIASSYLPCSSRTNPRLKCASAKVGACFATAAKPAPASSSLPARMAWVAWAKAAVCSSVCAEQSSDVARENVNSAGMHRALRLLIGAAAPLHMSFWRTLRNTVKVYTGYKRPHRIQKAKAGLGPAWECFARGSALDLSELIANCRLDLSWAIDHTMAATSRDTEELIRRISVNPAERVSVECVRNIEFEKDILTFPDHGPLDDCEVFILVAWTSPPGHSRWKISEYIATASMQGCRAWIFKRSTIYGAWCPGRIRGKYSIDRFATAVPSLVQRWSPLDGMSAKDGLSRNQTEPVVIRAIRVRSRVFVDDCGRSRLIAMNATDLPPSCDLTGNAVVQVFLTWPKRKLVQITDDNGMRDVLVADRLFSPQVVGILCAKDVGIEPGQSRERGIRVGDRF